MFFTQSKKYNIVAVATSAVLLLGAGVAVGPSVALAARERVDHGVGRTLPVVALRR